MWITIPCCPHYKINEEGKLLNTRNGRTLTGNVNVSTGYLEIILYDFEVKHYKLVHRLVAEAFIPNPNNLPVVNHIDKDTTNPKRVNLEWCTQQYNVEHSCAKTYVFKSPTGERVPIFNIRRFSRENNLNNSHMIQVTKGNRNSHKGWTLW